jgi:diguanylate cyclase (GGDEF)-like protein
MKSTAVSEGWRNPTHTLRSLYYPSLNLDLNSTLKDLNLDFFQVDISCLGHVVSEELQRNPVLSGVILTQNNRFWGVISRRRFLEQMSRPYGLELFSHRAILYLYKNNQTKALILSENTTIVEATRLALERPNHLLYEPIVVEMNNNQYKLLDPHQLLIAHSQIHELTATLLQKITQKLEAANSELHRLASLDGLTQIANRRRFDEYLEMQWRELSLQQKPLAILLADVDWFKAYNDACGHQAGDDCLQKVAQTFQNSLNQLNALAARYGGEEFAAILPNCNATEAYQIAEQICANLRALKLAHPGLTKGRCVTLSIGVASIIPTLKQSPLELLFRADRELYQAKTQGRDRVFG